MTVLWGGRILEMPRAWSVLRVNSKWIRYRPGRWKDQVTQEKGP